MTMVASMTTGLLESLGKVLWGFPPNLMRNIVEQHGPLGSLTWFVRNMPTYERILAHWGPIRTHLLATEISVLNGCPYCTYGHAYALQLNYLRETDQLLTFDEEEIVAWHSLSETEAVERFQSLIGQANLPAEGPILERMLILRRGDVASDSADDGRILHLIQMFGFLNQCGIRGKTSPDQAHDPINKDRTLRREYDRLRAASRQSSATDGDGSTP